MNPNNYDHIAGCYDKVSQLLFFNSQKKAQVEQLPYLKVHYKLLIVGGGTGWILEELSKIKCKEMEITYVERSKKMLELAKKRKHGNNKVKFIHLTIEEFLSPVKFDAIQTGFLFDNFSKEKVIQVFSILNQQLKPGGLWLFSDFEYDKKQGKFWQWLMLKAMYFLFRHISNIDAKELIDTAHHFKNMKYIKLIERNYYKGFIKSIIYRKTDQ